MARTYAELFHFACTTIRALRSSIMVQGNKILTKSTCSWSNNCMDNSRGTQNKYVILRSHIVQRSICALCSLTVHKRSPNFVQCALTVCSQCAYRSSGKECFRDWHMIFHMVDEEGYILFGLLIHTCWNCLVKYTNFCGQINESNTTMYWLT